MSETEINKRDFIHKLITASLSDQDGKKLVQTMDDTGISKSILLIADFGYAMGEAELSIEEIHLLHANVLKLFPDRFLVFSGIDPRRGLPGLELFQKAISVDKFKGLKLYPPCGFELDDTRLYPFYEICNSLNLPVLTHTGPSLNSMKSETKYPTSLLKVSAEFKNINFILGHGGARDWQTSISLAKQRKNVSFEISAFQLYTEGNSNDLETRFRIFFDQVPDQVMFGTDYPMFGMRNTQKQLVSMIQELQSINIHEKEKLFYKNSSSIIGIQ